MKKVFLTVIITVLCVVSYAQILHERTNLFSNSSYLSENHSKEYVATLSWASDNIAAGIGLDAEAILAGAAEFTSSDLDSYIGNFITEIEVGIFESDYITSGRIFIIENPLDNPNVVVNQTVNFSSDWNALMLTHPYEITGEDIFVGYEVNVTDGKPLGADGGPATDKGAWVRIGGEGSEWSKYQDVGINRNNSIKAIISTEGSFDEPIAGVHPSSFNSGISIFGQAVNSQEFNLTNLGVNVLTINSITSITGQWSTNIETSEVSLSEGESYSFNITFNPDHTDFLVDTLIISTNGGDVKISLFGQAVNELDCKSLNMELPGSLVLYEMPGGAHGTGYLSGNNSLGQLAIAEYFNYPLIGEIPFALIPLAHVDGTSGNVDFVVWEATDDGPGEAIFTQTVSMANLYSEFSSTNDIAIFSLIFDSPVPVNGDFFFGAILPTSGHDLAFYNSEIDLLPNTAWTQNSDGQWKSYRNQHGVAVKNLLIPEVCPLGQIVNISKETLSDINIFPNPAKDYFIVSNANKSEIVIYDIMGKIVYTNKTEGNKHIINTSEFSAGTYFVKVNTDVFKVSIVK